MMESVDQSTIIGNDRTLQGSDIEDDVQSLYCKSSPTSCRILVKSSAADDELLEACQLFNVPVSVVDDVYKDPVEDVLSICVLDTFDDVESNEPNYKILGRTALLELARRKENNGTSHFLELARPLYCHSLSGQVICFTGFKKREDLVPLKIKVHHMGGSIRKRMFSKVTHLVAKSCGGDKYEYAMTFRVPVLDEQWVHDAWLRRHEIAFDATHPIFMLKYKLKPFHDARVCFLGFPEEEKSHMIDVLKENGGEPVDLSDPTCTHLVLDTHLNPLHLYSTISSVSANKRSIEPVSPLLPYKKSKLTLDDSVKEDPLQEEKESSDAKNTNSLDDTPMASKIGKSSSKLRSSFRTMNVLKKIIQCTPDSQQSIPFVKNKQLAALISVFERMQSLKKRSPSRLHGKAEILIDENKDTPCKKLKSISEMDMAHLFNEVGAVQISDQMGNRFEELAFLANKSIQQRLTNDPLVGDAEHFNEGAIARCNSGTETDELLSQSPVLYKFDDKIKTRDSKVANLFSSDETFNGIHESTVCKEKNYEEIDRVGGKCQMERASLEKDYTELSTIDDCMKSSVTNTSERVVFDANRICKNDETVAVPTDSIANLLPFDDCRLNKLFLSDELDGDASWKLEGGHNLTEVPTVNTLSNEETDMFDESLPQGLFCSSVVTPCMTKNTGLDHDVPSSNTASNDAALVDHSGTQLNSSKPDVYMEIFKMPDVIPHLQKILSYWYDKETSFQDMVVDESKISATPLLENKKTYVVKAEWFWTSVQNDMRENELNFKFENVNEQSPTEYDTPVRASTSVGGRIPRKRKRLRDKLSSFGNDASPCGQSAQKRRSSASDVTRLSEGSFLDYTVSPDIVDDSETPVRDKPKASPRYCKFLELCQTETNYVGILRTIMTLFKSLEQLVDTDAQLINATELKIIFGHLPPIYETHCSMLEELINMANRWTEESSIGNLILKYSKNLVKAYPPFINFFENTRDMLIKCDRAKPRFHAFLKVCQSKPECGRQSLQDLLIRPVQRLPSINLLLTDILRYTTKNSADHKALELAISSVQDVMTHINEDKRKTEGQVALFDIFNDIENCPAHLVSSQRCFIGRCEVTEISDNLSGKGKPLVLFLFSDVLEVCKKRMKAFNNIKSPKENTGSLGSKHRDAKIYKHVKLLPLTSILKVIDIKESDDCRNVFSLLVKNCENIKDAKDKLYSFTITDEIVEKSKYLRMLSSQIANVVCKTDTESYLTSSEAQQLNIDLSEASSGTLGKAFGKFATKTRIRVGRALSFNKTPSKVKRVVSTMMSPFTSQNGLTPSLHQLANLQLAALPAPISNKNSM